MGDDLLRAKRESRGILGRQRECFVFRIGMQRLRASEYSRERLYRDAHDIHVRLLGGQRGTGRLNVKTHHQGARISGAEAIAHDRGIEAARGSILGDLFQELVVCVKEE